MEGTPFGRYRLVELLGRGGMGEVWRAYDTVTDRMVALKVLPAHFVQDSVFQQRFRREAHAAAQLNEPHVVPIHTYGEIDGRLFVDMRLIDGRDLKTVLAGGPLSPERAVRIIEQVAQALHAAHKVGLVHRDIKPSNILLDDNDFAHLIDFGLARSTEQTSLTSAGKVIGTLSYMAPERFTSGQADARSDIYALACVLYECLTGFRPFPGDSLDQQLAGHLTAPPPRPSARQAGVPVAMDQVIATGMAKSPQERYATTVKLARAARDATTWPFAPPGRIVPVHPPMRPVQPTVGGVHGQDTRLATAGAAPVLPPPPGPPRWQPPPPQPMPAPKRPDWRRPRVVIPAVVAIVVLIGGGIFAAVMVSQHHNPTSTPTATPTAAAPPPNTGPFTGTFAANMGPEMLADGKPATGKATAKFSETWHLRSVCSDNACVATASTGGRYPAKELVFDNVGGRWIAVTTSRTSCANRENDEDWNVVSLQPQPDGTMSGEATEASASACFNKRTVILARTADADISLLPDPASLPPRVVSPAEALHGRYDEVITYANGHVNRYADGVRTDCLRTGDRCMSFFVDLKTAGGEAYVFGNGTWTRNTEFESACSGGGTDRGTDHSKFTATLPLPQPPQDPITLLTGHGYVENSPPAKCPSQAFDQKFTRTGD